jgi:hypothetical protein
MSTSNHDTSRAVFTALRQEAELPPGGSNLLKSEVLTIAEQLGVSTTGSKCEITARLFGYQTTAEAPNRNFNYITKSEAVVLTDRLTEKTDT